MSLACVEAYSIAELLDDPIVKLLMESDGVNRSDLQDQLAITARSQARAQAGEP